MKLNAKWGMLVAFEIVILITAGILGATLGAVPANRHRPTELGLSDDFHEYNDKYFYGALPRTEIKLIDLTAQDIMGSTLKQPNGSFLVSIDPGTNPVLKQAEMTLLHEMCHIKLRNSINLIPGETTEKQDSHGPSFQACMIDLAKHDAFKDLW